MKKALLLTFVVVYVLSMAGSALAAESRTWMPLEKLGRGISNIATCPLEIGKNVEAANESDGIFAAYSWGLLKGSADTLVRAVVGIYEVVTFPLPVPADYAPILTNPEYFLKDNKEY